MHRCNATKDHIKGIHIIYYLTAAYHINACSLNNLEGNPEHDQAHMENLPVMVSLKEKKGRKTKSGMREGEQTHIQHACCYILLFFNIITIAHLGLYKIALLKL